MRANKGKDTIPEISVRSALREMGFPGYRLHWKAVSGRPDICYPGRKIAIFVHGCFWHRCPRCNLKEPMTHREYWTPKFRRNIERDREKIMILENKGWKVFVIWECEIRDDAREAIRDVVKYLEAR